MSEPVFGLSGSYDADVFVQCETCHDMECVETLKEATEWAAGHSCP